MWIVLSKLPLANIESSGDQLRSTYFKHGKAAPQLDKYPPRPIQIHGNYLREFK
jgi:hypothetical protein